MPEDTKAAKKKKELWKCEKKKHGKITKAKIRIIIEKRRRKEEDENKMNFGRGGDATGP